MENMTKIYEVRRNSEGNFYVPDELKEGKLILFKSNDRMLFIENMKAMLIVDRALDIIDTIKERGYTLDKSLVAKTENKILLKIEDIHILYELIEAEDEEIELPTSLEDEEEKKYCIFECEDCYFQEACQFNKYNDEEEESEGEISVDEREICNFIDNIINEISHNKIKDIKLINDNDNNKISLEILMDK